MLTYPATARERNEWIMARRGPRRPLDPARPYAFLVEKECAADRKVVEVATLFLTNKECPFRCLMCDLWRNTLPEPLSPGVIPGQIEYALWRLPRARQIKLYNSGSFFDPGAIPVEDYPAVASLAGPFERIIVESHPAFLGGNCLRFRDLAARPLEVAVGLETAHPEILERLNKRMSLKQFSRAAAFLEENRIALRVFLLVNLPFLSEAENAEWVRRSICFAFENGASVVSLIPTREGNGAMEALRGNGEFVSPGLEALEAAHQFGLGLGRGRVFADLWDLERFKSCPDCFPARKERLERMNLTQANLPPVPCACGSGEFP